MAVSSEFRALVEEMFEAAIGPVTVKRMFGGIGIFRDGLMFALVLDETLFLKTGLDNVERFRTAGLEFFRYQNKHRLVETSYARAPEDALEDPEILRDWTEGALQAARAAAARPKSRRKNAQG